MSFESKQKLIEFLDKYLSDLGMLSTFLNEFIDKYRTSLPNSSYLFEMFISDNYKELASKDLIAKINELMDELDIFDYRFEEILKDLHAKIDDLKERVFDIQVEVEDKT